MDAIVDAIDPDRPVLLAGATASGKSALALRIVARQGGVIVNADALQVYSDWRILTARPSPQDEAVAPHHLYGHVPGDRSYSVGDWLRAVAPLLDGARPVIVGGTGLYFRALTDGLAEIPSIPPDIRAAGDARLAGGGLAAMLGDLDAATRRRIDPSNPARVRRGWEVLHATGRGLALWQDDTPPPALPAHRATCLLLTVAPDVLSRRIAARVDAMVAGGGLDEARANRAGWTPSRPSAKAIGAAELMAYLEDRIDRATLRERMIVQTRQYAKRQRTWFRARMSDWTRI